MQRLTRTLAAVALGAGLTACGGETPVHEEQFMGLGTVVSIQLAGVDEATAEEAITAIRADLEYIEGSWYPWREGTVARNNVLLETGGEFTSSPGVLRLIEAARPLEEASDGLFNPTLARLSEAWGFHEADPGGPPPDDETLRAIVEAEPSLADITIDGIRMQTDNSAVQLDFGGFAKGVAVDRAMDELRERGIEDAIVNLGGDLRGTGDRGDRPWRIGIQDPRGDGVLASLTIEGDEAIFTSGDYERGYEHDGTYYHHILDPRTGRPARGTASVTVIHDNGAEADAAATALFVADAEQWPAIARAMGTEAVLRVADDGTVQLTPAMAERIAFQEAGRQHEVVELP